MINWGLFRSLTLSFFLVVVSLNSRAERVVFLASGQDAFDSRADLILEAKKSIQVEYFSIWNDEYSLRFLSLLLKKAHEGVKVSIIFDALASRLPKSLIASLENSGTDSLGNRNLEIRFYNPFNILRPLDLQHREHGKMLIVDGEYLITGGRNIGNKYFDSDPERNFLDADVLIHGATSKRAQENFLILWNSGIAKPAYLAEYSSSQLQDVFCYRTAGQNYGECESRRRWALKEIADQTARLEFHLGPLFWFNWFGILADLNGVFHQIFNLTRNLLS